MHGDPACINHKQLLTAGRRGGVETNKMVELGMILYMSSMAYELFGFWKGGKGAVDFRCIVMQAHRFMVHEQVPEGNNVTALKSHRARDDGTQALKSPRLDNPRTLHQTPRLEIRDHSETVTVQASSTVLGVERLRNSEVGATSEVLLKKKG
jgi:hypothetical protein